MKRKFFIITSVIVGLTFLLTSGIKKKRAFSLPAVFNHFNGTVGISENGTTVTLTSNGVPDHKSPYFGSADSRYQLYDGTNPNWAVNPNSIGTQNYVFNIPENPTAAASHAATGLGPIGISVNGVPLYNQYAGPAQPLTNEINSFDQFGGHPDQVSRYHYHVEPLYITATRGKDALIGFLLDGFPVYGPMENCHIVTSSDLDTYHGHFSITADYPAGIYHYHITADAPYINGSGYWGTPGTVTN